MATRTIAVGGGNWTASGTWVEGSAPTAADDVIATAVSGNVTVDAGAVCRSADFTNYAGTLTHTAGVTWTIGDATAGAGNVALKLVSGMTYTLGGTATSALSFVSTSATQQTVTTAGKNIGSTTFNGAGGSWSLSDGFSQSAATASFVLLAGTLNLNGQTCQFGTLVSNGTNTRTLTMGAADVTLKGTGIVQDFNSTGLTFNCGTSTISFKNSTVNATVTMYTAGKTFYNVVFDVYNSYCYVWSSASFNNLTLTNASYANPAQAVVHFAANQTITGTFTVNSQSASKRLAVKSNDSVTPYTITAAATSLNHADFFGITAAGAASPFVAASGNLGDCGRNTNITFASPVSSYWVGGAGSMTDTTKWASSSGGTASSGRFPLPQDTAVFDANSGTGTVTGDIVRYSNLTMTNASITAFTFQGLWGGTQFHGSVGLGSTVTYTFPDGQQLGFVGMGSHTIDFAGKTAWTSANTSFFVVRGGTYTAQSDITTNGTGVGGGALNLDGGTFNANGFNMNFKGVQASGSNTRTLTMGSGLWTISGVPSGNVWNTTTTGLTFNAGSQAVVFSGTSGAPTITTGGLSMPPVTFNGVGGNWTFSDNFTTTGNVTLTTGTLNMNGRTCSFGQFAFHGSGVRTLTLGAAVITITAASAGNGWRCDTSTNCTITANTAVVTFTGTIGMINGTTIDHGGTSFVFNQNTTMVVYNGGFSNVSATAVAPANKTSFLQMQTSSTWAPNVLTVSTGGFINGALDLPGLANHNATTPDTAALDITGSIDLQAKVDPVVWASGGNSPVLFKDGGSNASYGLNITNTGFLKLHLSADGSTLLTATSSAISPGVAGTPIWIRATWLQSTGVVQFFTSSDGSSWTQLGTDQSIAIASIFSGTGTLRVGTAAGFFAAHFNGKIYRAIVKNGIGGTAVFDADFSTQTTGATSFTEATGKTVTVNGNSIYNRILMRSDVRGTARTINPTAHHFSNVDFQDITKSGAALTGTSLGDARGNTNITFPSTLIRYGVVAGNWSSTATWSASSGGAGGASVPLPHDIVVLNASAGAGTYTADMPRLCKNLDCTGFTRTLAFNSTPTSLFGDVTLGSGMTLSGTQATTLVSRSAATLTSAGKAFPQTIILEHPGTTLTLQDNFATSGTLQQDYGTFTANNFTVTALQFSSNNSNTRTVNMGTAAWTLTGAVAGAWTTVTSTNLTLNVSTAVVNFTATSGTGTIFTGGIGMPAVNFNGVGGTWQLADNYTTASLGAVDAVKLTAGTLDLNDKTVTVTGRITSSGSAVRSLLMKASSVIITTGAGGTVWGATGTNYTLDAGTSTLTINNGNVNFDSSSRTYNNVVINANGGPFSFNNGTTNTFANLTFTSTAVKTAWVCLQANMTVTGTFTATGNSSVNRLLVGSLQATPGTQHTISAAAVSLSNVDFQDVNASGAATWAGTSIGDALGNTNITFDAPVTRYAITTGNWSSTATWSATSGGAGGASVPLPQDSVVFDVNSNNGAGTYSYDMPRAGKDITTTSGFTKTLDLNGVSTTIGVSIFGSLTYGSSNTGTAGLANYFIFFAGRGSHSINTLGKSFPSDVRISAPGGTYTLASNLVAGGGLVHTAGTFDLNGFNVNSYHLSSTSGLTRSLTLGSGTYTVTGNGGNVTIVSTGLTLSAASSTIVFSDVASAHLFQGGGGFTYGTLSYTAAGTGNTLTITGANTFNTINVSGGTRTLTMPASTTTTVTNLNVNGTAGNLVIVQSSTPGTAATLSKTSGLVGLNYASIRDLTLTGGAVWQARNSTNTSGNTGMAFILDGAWGLSA